MLHIRHGSIIHVVVVANFHQSSQRSVFACSLNEVQLYSRFLRQWKVIKVMPDKVHMHHPRSQMKHWSAESRVFLHGVSSCGKALLPFPDRCLAQCRQKNKIICNYIALSEIGLSCDWSNLMWFLLGKEHWKMRRIHGCIDHEGVRVRRKPHSCRKFDITR